MRKWRKSEIQVFCAIFLFLFGSHAYAATLYVEADGSGDFPTIQAAVDFAEPGDTIQLGAGLFDDYVSGDDYDCYVYVTKDNLTFRGVGVDETVIGQIAESPHSEYVYVFKTSSDLVLRLENLTLQLMEMHNATLVKTIHSQLFVSTCALRNCGEGIYNYFSQGFEIDNCEFTNISGDAISTSATVPSLIKNTTFENVRGGLYVIGPETVFVQNCYFEGSGNGSNTWATYCEGYGDVEFQSCTFENHTRAAVLVSGARTYMYDCQVLESAGNGIELYDGVFGGSGNTIRSDVYVIVCSNVCDVVVDEFHDNRLLAGSDGLAVLVYTNIGTPRTYDFTNNWWGTVDEDEIAALIHDREDDPALTISVTYEPFQGGPVSIEGRTLSDVKSIFQ